MRTNITYGTWTTKVDGFNVSLEATALNRFSADGVDGYDYAAVVTEYRAAINDALPDSVALVGKEFIGPFTTDEDEFQDYPKDAFGQLDFKAIVDTVDFWAIVAKHRK